MDQHAVTEVLDRTAGALIDLAYELRALCSDRDQVSESTVDSNRAQIVKRIKAFWNGVSLSPILEVGRSTIDLSEAEGRWELLVLGFLRAARVKEEIAVATFEALKDEGLLALEQLVPEKTVQRERVNQVFEQTYRALGRREDKVDALFFNAHLLVTRWNGDLNHLYEAARHDRELVDSLQCFRQVKRIALWVARTLRVHGVWPEAGGEACRYYDRWVRLTVNRLNLSDTQGEERSFQGQAEETEAAVEELFGGDVLPVYLHGYSLCAQNDPQVCLTECPVASWCTFPRMKPGESDPDK